MDVTAKLIELKAGSDERVRDWAEFLRQHREEATATLVNEGVSIESWFEVTLDGRRYLLCYQRAASMATAAAVAAHAENPVDAYHRQFKVETWVRGGGADGQLLVDLEVGSAP